MEQYSTGAQDRHVQHEDSQANYCTRVKCIEQYVHGTSENICQQEEQQLVVIKSRNDTDIKVFGVLGPSLGVERRREGGSQHVRQWEHSHVCGQEDGQHHTAIGELEETRKWNYILCTHIKEKSMYS